MSKRTAAQTRVSLRKKLIRVAHDHPEKRVAAFKALKRLGYDFTKAATVERTAAQQVLANLEMIAGDSTHPEKQATAQKLLAKFGKGDKMPNFLLEKFKGKRDDEKKKS